MIVVDPKEAVTIGLHGDYKIPVLLRVDAPLGARFPAGGQPPPKPPGDDWFIHLGDDGSGEPDRTSGPIQATILPDIIGNHADAFLMIQGRGITAFGRRKPISRAEGFILAFGFGVEFVFGLKGVIWAEVHASADILLATNPLLLAGFGNVGGGLHLGPVSIGVDALLTFKLEDSQSAYLLAQVCGRVDLIFFDIEGCATIEVAHAPLVVVPPPNEHPLERLEGDQILPNASLVDAAYRRIGALATTPDAAEVVWPDSILHLAFSTPPSLAAGVAPQFPALASTYGARARPVGSDLLHYDWTLTGLELRDVTADPQGAGVLVPGALSAAWLPGKAGDVNRSAEPAELVLLTPDGDLWLRRTTNAGRELSNDPLAARGDICHLRAQAARGWSLGFDAEAHPRGWRLRPASVSCAPVDSQVRGLARPGVSLAPGAVLGPRSGENLPAPYTYLPAGIVPLAAPLPSLSQFAGFLRLPFVGWPNGLTGDFGPPRQTRQQLAISLDEPLSQVDIWLLVLGDAPADPAQLVVEDAPASQWPGAAAGSSRVLRYRAPRDGVTEVTVDWPCGLALGLLGLSGVTASALAAARTSNDALDAQTALLAAAKVAGPAQQDTVVSGAQRTVLDPDRTYRLDVGLSWTGVLTEIDDHGGETTTQGGGDQYLPRGAAGAAPCQRSYWFRTAKALTPATVEDQPKPIMDLAPAFGSESFLSFKRRLQNFFHPAMLERYFIGSEPGQSEAFRFRDDSLAAHFSANHVAVLAGKYGYDLKLGLRRVDAPDNEGDTEVLDVALIALSDPTLLDPLGRRLNEIAAASTCSLPVPGATLIAARSLAAQAWYEVYVLAQSRDRDAVKDGRLPGVTFRTSRWRSPADMLIGLGFGSDVAPGRAAGDLLVKGNPPTGVIIGDDVALEAALAALDLDGLAPPDASRLSLAWTRGTDGTWLLAGLLVESPEPVARPGRLEIAGVFAVPAGNAFTAQRIDQAGARLLFCVEAPFAPRPRQVGLVMVDPALRLDLVDRASGETLSGRLALPARPKLPETP